MVFLISFRSCKVHARRNLMFSHARL